jgi:hypothetical protein
MAEQNKTVLIAGIVIAALVVIGVGSYVLFAGSKPPPPVVISQPAPPTDNAPSAEEKKTRATRPRDTDQPTKAKTDRGGQEKPPEEGTEDVREKKTRSIQPRGAVP